MTYLSGYLEDYTHFFLSDFGAKNGENEISCG
jgi:hypothetical protein